jgi:hypothetical protein
MNCCLREMAALQLFSHPNIARLVGNNCFIKLLYSRRNNINGIVFTKFHFIVENNYFLRWKDVYWGCEM